MRIPVPAVLVLLVSTAAFALQLRPFREYPGTEYENFPVPPDYQEKTEWVFARLMYPPIGFDGGYWKLGGSNWTIDYPRSDRHLSQAVRRLTRIHLDRSAAILRRGPWSSP